MKTKREGQPKAAARRKDPDRRSARRPHHDEEPARRKNAAGRPAVRRPADAPPRGGRPRNAKAANVSRPAREARALRHGPPTAPVRKVAAPAKTTRQAKARAKARKAKAPKVVRVPLRERMLRRLAAIELNPRTLIARVPFVVLVIGSLGVGLAVTLWLSTDAAERSYQLGRARQTNNVLLQQKEALERDVLEAQAAPALAESARNLGMIPSRDTAHLVQDPGGNWVVVGTPKPAEGVPPPPLNAKLPDDPPPVPANAVERPVRVSDLPPAPAPVPPGAAAPVPPGAAGPVLPGTTGAVPLEMPAPAVPGAVGPEVLMRTAPPSSAVPLDHAPAGAPSAATPGLPLTGPVPGPVVAPDGIPTLPGPAPAPAPAAADVPAPPAPVVAPGAPA